jgi:hypothetical protein
MVYELMCTFFFNCHTYSLASDTRQGQSDWRKNRGQFRQKNLWLRVGVIGEVVRMNGGVSVTSSNAYHLKYFIEDRPLPIQSRSQRKAA